MRSARAFVAIGILVALCGVIAYWWIPTNAKEPVDQSGIPVAKVADYLHSVIEANRIFYTVQVVERMQFKGVVTATEHWRVTNTLPLPAQFLRETADLATKTGSKIDYRLISLWPINKQNGPADVFEREGLNDLLKQQERAYTGTITRGGERYFRAIYADRAITQACIGCHNVHPNSPKKDFKQGDVMGGVVISIPLGEP
jgi:hypothetical protein